MLVILDTNMLTLLLKPSIPPPHDPRTKAAVVRAAERVELLIDELAANDARILIPAPVWAEFLVAADDAGPVFAAKLKERAAYEIVPFDAISAVEAAIDQRKALKTGNKKIKLDGTRQCVKADRQIVAIGKTRKVDVLYAADKDIVNIGESMGVNIVPLWDLPLPAEEPSKTPLLDLAAQGATAPEASTIAIVQPSAQSPDAVTAKADPPVPVPPSVPPVAPAPPQPGSSPTVAPPPQSKQ